MNYIVIFDGTRNIALHISDYTAYYIDENIPVTVIDSFYNEDEAFDYADYLNEQL